MDMGKRSVSGLVIFTKNDDLWTHSIVSMVVDPPDDVLKVSLLTYIQRGLTQKEKTQRLASDHGLAIGCAMIYGYRRNWENDSIPLYRTTTLNILERRLGIPSVRRTPAGNESGRQAVLDELEKDVMNANAPRFIQERLRHKGVMLTRY